MSDAYHDHVKALWDSGLGAPEIAKELGRGNTSIYRALSMLGIKPSEENRRISKIRKFTDEQEKELAADYAAGMDLDELQAKWHCSRACVRAACRRAGVPLRSIGGQARELTPEEEAEIIERRLRGESQQKIADALHTSQPRISRFLRSQGIYSLTYKGRPVGTGRLLNPAGYVTVLLRDDHPFAAMRNRSGYVLEHRLVMAEMVGRPLEPHETVHHINGDRQDNRPENLQLRQGKHGRGAVLVCGDCGSENIVGGRIADPA